MNSYRLDEWIPIEETHLSFYKSHNISEVMFKVFDEYCEDEICTASVCLKFDNGAVTGFYHPPEEAEGIDEKFLFKVEVNNES